MAIRDIFIAGCFVVLALISISAYSQATEKKVFELNSLESSPVKVDIELDNVNDKITLSLNPLETICISGYRGLVEDIKILDRTFIELQYKIRAGSGVKSQRTILFCVSKGHLCKTIDITSMNSYEFKDTYDKETDSLGLYYESGVYKITIIKLQNTEKNSYQLIATEYENIKSKQDASKNHQTLDTLKLNFDEKNRVFYTQCKPLNENYVFEESGKNKVFKGDKYPLIKLKNEEYIFIEKIWYNKVRGNHLIKSLPNCK